MRWPVAVGDSALQSGVQGRRHLAGLHLQGRLVVVVCRVVPVPAKVGRGRPVGLA